MLGPIRLAGDRCWTAITLLLVGALLAGAWPATRSATAARASTPLDVAAMTLVLTDVGEPGLALAGGGRVSLPDVASRIARGRGQWRSDEAAALSNALAGAGWQRGYESRLAVLQHEVPDRRGAMVVSSVAEYAEVPGATAAYALLASNGSLASARELPVPTPVGDESRMTRTFVPGPGAATPARRLELTFRLGNLIGAVAMVDLADERQPGIATLQALAARLLARIEAVRAGGAPGLEPRVLRLDRPGMPPPVYDVYDRIRGETFPLYGVDPEDAADREHLYGGAIDVYTYERFLTTGDVVGATPYYAVKLYRFSDSAAAAAWLEGAPEALFADPGSFLNLGLVQEAATIGEGSRTIEYEFPATDTVTTRGYRVYARIGSEVARVQLDGAPEVPLAVVESFARAQAACLAVPTCLETPPLPPELLSRAPAQTSVDL